MYQRKEECREEERNCGNCRHNPVPVTDIVVRTQTSHRFIVYSEPCNSCKRARKPGEAYNVADKWESKRALKASAIIEEVKADICDKYCRYPELTSEDELGIVCDACPLNRL